MMMPSNFIIFQVSIVVLFMTTFTLTTNIPEPTAMVSEVSQSYDEERNPGVVVPNHHHNLDNIPSSSKDIAFNDDDSSSDEEDDDDYAQIHHYKAVWPNMLGKRYANKITRGGDSRVWAIPYRFGKRAAMPYRFGKRAGMHFRLGK